MRKLISSILVVMFASAAFGQNLQGFEFIVGYKAIAVGDVLGKDTEQLIKSKEVKIESELSIPHIIDHTSDQTKGYKAAINITTPKENHPFWAKLTANRSTLTKARLYVDSGYVMALKFGTLKTKEQLRTSLSVGTLQNLYNDMGRRAKIVSDVFFVKKGSLSVAYDESLSANVATPLDSATASFNRPYNDSNAYVYSGNHSIAYKSVVLKKREVKKWLCERQNEDCRVWTPLGFKQFDSKRTFAAIRGGVWMAGELGGLAGGAIYGKKWWQAYSNYRNNYEAEPFLDKKSAMTAEVKKYRERFWLSIGVMLGSYGLNVLDNCYWTKAKGGQRLTLAPVITPQSGEISLTYNF